MNEDYSIFLDDFGPGVCYQAPSDEFFEKYKGILPDELLEFWREQGWRSYAKGLFWTVNPDEYGSMVAGWVRPFDAMTKADYYIFARTAFGEFFCMSPESNRVLTISCPNAMLYASKAFFKVVLGGASAVESFFLASDREDFDFIGHNGKALFARALKKLGPLTADEVYGFVPLLTQGGNTAIENLQKLRMDVHIELLKQSADIQLDIM